MADRAIEWMQRVKAHRPDKPFLCYFAPGAVHTPLHVPDAWLDRFKGFFDEGWDDLRQSIFERQLDLGVIPPDTVNTPRPDVIPSWDEYPDRYKPVARRLMEVFAAFLAHTDAQVARLIEAIEAMGEWEDTLFVYITGDNGASAEGRIHGTWSLPALQNGAEEDPEFLLEHIDDFGTVRSECHYNVGWAWALDAPFQWMKQVASHFGGTRNGLAISWPRRITDAGADHPGGGRHRGADVGERNPADAHRGHLDGLFVRRPGGGQRPPNPVLRDDGQPGHLPRRLHGLLLPREGALGALRVCAVRRAAGELGALRHPGGLLPEQRPGR